MKITVHVLFSKPIKLSQKLRINDASLLHWETGEKKAVTEGGKEENYNFGAAVAAAFSIQCPIL